MLMVPHMHSMLRISLSLFLSSKHATCVHRSFPKNKKIIFVTHVFFSCITFSSIFFVFSTNSIGFRRGKDHERRRHSPLRDGRRYEDGGFSLVRCYRWCRRRRHLAPGRHPAFHGQQGRCVFELRKCFVVFTSSVLTQNKN